jgi:hypothetical protein
MGQRAEERREQRRLATLPRLAIRETDKPSWEDRVIEVLLPDGTIASKDALFYIVTIGNDGGRRTDHIAPIISSDFSDYTIPLDFIWFGSDAFRVKWNGRLEDFRQDRDCFANALVRDENTRTENPALEGDSFPISFVLLFTVKGSRKIYLPTRYYTTMPTMPCKLNFELYVTASGVSTTRLATYEVETSGTGWRSISVTETPEE